MPTNHIHRIAMMFVKMSASPNITLTCVILPWKSLIWYVNMKKLKNAPPQIIIIMRMFCSHYHWFRSLDNEKSHSSGDASHQSSMIVNPLSVKLYSLMLMRAMVFILPTRCTLLPVASKYFGVSPKLAIYMSTKSCNTWYY